jgi:hypothetical protein
MADVVTSPIKFLGATVLSFNTSLGLSSGQESTLNVDLIEDCDVGDSFLALTGAVEVGSPVYFSAPNDGSGFNFGGVLINWTVNQGSSGKTYNVKISDPRQLLENTMVIVDTYLGEPIQSTNYFNVYAKIESSVLGGNCNVFGDSKSTERGMPYTNVITALQNMNPNICSPTGYIYTVNFNSFPQGLPEYYRVPGPGVSILQLLQDVCDVMGYEFYVDLLPGNIINIGLINVSAPPGSFDTIISAYQQTATDLSYGQELRNEKTKMLVFGEKQHYMSIVNKFNFFFGEEWNGNEFIPIIPYKYTDENGFWISKRVQDLNVSLKNPLGGNGPYTISEKDIKAAMTSFQVWFDRVFCPDIPGSFNAAVRQNFVVGHNATRVLDMLKEDPDLNSEKIYQAYVDAWNTPTNKEANQKPQEIMDLEQVHSYIQNLGNTYYGRQFFTQLNQTICAYRGENYQEIIFTDEPTNAGGWVDEGTPILGLSDPELTTFRQTDNRIGSFAIFAQDSGSVDTSTTEIGQDESQLGGGSGDTGGTGD